MHNANSTDPRVRRTRQMIQDAFIDLIQEVDYKKITVNLITQRAGINRVTFYLHYRDLEDMIESMVSDMIQDIESILLDYERVDGQNDLELDILTRLLEYIADHAKIYKILLVSKQLPLFTQQFIELIVKLILQNVETRQLVPSNHRSTVVHIPKDIIAWYGASATVGTISIWLGNDMPYSPHFLATQIVKLNPYKQIMNY